MKNVKMLVAVALIGTTAMTISSCGKYEDGPGMSLLTKKMRLTGEWDLKETEDPDGNTLTDNDSDYVTFDKDGTYTYTDGSVSQSGEWSFTDSKEKIKIGVTYGGTTFSSEIEILRLTNKELWTKDEDGYISRSEKR